MKKWLIWIIAVGALILLIIGIFIYDKFTRRSYDINDCSGLDNENLCLAHGRTCGPCEMLVMWYEYDIGNNSCIRKSGSGCKSAAPFRTLEECEDACVN